ncbi:MAG: hypothetical protein RL026_2282 [Pseudomonadota bacterium]|jgi:uncharacterized membrane protein YedE/YeeE
MSRELLQRLVEFAAGLVFGCGLLIAGMTDPAKVLAFLDLAGAWDPSLMLVMGGAIAVGACGFALLRNRALTPLGCPVDQPSSQGIDRRLILGSVIFGVGWGLAGICPGPGLVNLAAGEWQAAWFVAGMVGGMLVYHRLDGRQ